MGTLKMVKALEEEMFIKGITKQVNKNIKTCTICQMVKPNNEKKEGTMIPITSNTKLEKVFLDICGPFPRSGCLLYTSVLPYSLNRLSPIEGFIRGCR